MASATPSKGKNNGAVIGFEAKAFEEKMKRLVTQLNNQFAECAKLEEAIRANLEGLGLGG